VLRYVCCDWCLTYHFLALRYIKLRTSCGSNLLDLALGINRNPLRKTLPVIKPSEDYTTDILESFKHTLEPQTASQAPLYKDRMTSGWLVWATTDDRYIGPALESSTFQPWEPNSLEAVNNVHAMCCRVEYWRSLSTYFAEESSQETLTMDNISATKSICKW
jgi:proteasome activator subunit 4